MEKLSDIGEKFVIGDSNVVDRMTPNDNQIHIVSEIKQKSQIPIWR